MAKLFAIFAAQAPVGVILRRGPSHWYHVIRWNVDHDTFEHGAWIKGRIYESHCDVSPDGNLLVYAVMRQSFGQPGFPRYYTAVSRLPWLTALAVWPEMTTYEGGGHFTGNRSLTILAGKKHHPDFPPDGLQLGVWHGSLRDFRSEPSGFVEGADWCGRDYKNRLLFSRGGRLFQRVDADDTLLADFENLTPDPKPAPDWAGLPLTPNGEKAVRKKKRRARR